MFQSIQLSRTVLFQTIQFSIKTVSISKTILIQTIQFCLEKQFYHKKASV